jgi:PAS domain S-box-containing protein
MDEALSLPAPRALVAWRVHPSATVILVIPSQKIWVPWQRALLSSLGFGALALLLGYFHLHLPTLGGSRIDLRESGLLAATFYLGSWGWTLLPAGVAALAAGEGQRFALLAHLLALPLAWRAQASLRRSAASVGILVLRWCGFVLLYFAALLLPARATLEGATAAASAGGFASHYPAMVRGAAVEALFTAAVTALVLASVEGRARRSRAETAQRESEARLGSILQAVPTGIGALVDGRVVWANQKLAKLLGVKDPQELTGLLFDDLITGGPDGAPPLADVRASMNAIRSETWLRRLDGSRFAALLGVSPLRSGQPGESLTVTVLDITDRLALQERLITAKKVEAVGLIAGGVAHEVRNPLFSITATLDAFADKLAGLPELAQMEAMIRRQLEQVGSLMSDLLDYGRAGAGERSLEPLQTPVRFAVAECAELARAAGVILDASVPADLPRLAMDSGRLVQVVRNLVQNAIAFSPAGARVEVLLTVERGAGRATLQLEVLDRGPGFKPDELARVFEPFFTRRKGGTGLGLSLVQRIVEEHGGTVVAGNREGGGARMVVRLPAAQGE